jgi:nucleoside-diphosphate-sugar epimerase
MKIFLTGGTGFIGSHFVSKALSDGHNLTCLIRPGIHKRIRLENEPSWIEGTYEDNYDEVFKGCDVFVHLAAHSTNFPYDTLENCLHWNVIAPLRLLQSAKKNGIQKFIIIGTGFEYGLSGEKYDFIPVDAPLIPKMNYPVSKAVGSLVFSQWALENNLKLKYLRIFQVYGEGEDKNRLWPSLKRAAELGDDFELTNGEQVRDFTYVDDIAKKIIDELKYFNFEIGKTLFKNIGSDKPQTVREFVEYWWNYWNAKGKLIFGSKEYREDEIMRFVPEL